MIDSNATNIFAPVSNVSQIVTLDKTFLVERIGSLPDYLQEEVDQGLRTLLYLNYLS